MLNIVSWQVRSERWHIVSDTWQRKFLVILHGILQVRRPTATIKIDTILEKIQLISESELRSSYGFQFEVNVLQTRTKRRQRNQSLDRTRETTDVSGKEIRLTWVSLIIASVV